MIAKKGINIRKPKATDQFAWLKEKLERFYQVYSPRVKELDAAEYTDSEEEDQHIL